MARRQLHFTLIKSHGYGNDFLLAESAAVSGEQDLPDLARRVCERHRGVGADGLILFDLQPGGASMRLFNADGSHSEVSGNGVRCLAAWIASSQGLGVGATIAIETEAGTKSLTLLDTADDRYTFRASMGQPEQIKRLTIPVNGQSIDVITLRVGNPQCVVLGDVTQERLHTIAAALAVHPHFAEGTNVELATVEAPNRVRILIWERGVGPTEASGTGACGAAVAAIAYGGASRDVQITSPGGTQRVEWLDEGLYLTGWAAIVAECRWLSA